MHLARAQSILPRASAPVQLDIILIAPRERHGKRHVWFTWAHPMLRIDLFCRASRQTRFPNLLRKSLVRISPRADLVRVLFFANHPRSSWNSRGINQFRTRRTSATHCDRFLITVFLLPCSNQSRHTHNAAKVLLGTLKLTYRPPAFGGPGFRGVPRVRSG